jgi:hypothetical protein
VCRRGSIVEIYRVPLPKRVLNGGGRNTRKTDVLPQY